MDKTPKQDIALALAQNADLRADLEEMELRLRSMIKLVDAAIRATQRSDTCIQNVRTQLEGDDA